MARPPIGPLNNGPTDEATDAWDTIDWLVKHTPESNDRVGVIGISYDGWTTLMALLHPHPALRAAVPINAAVDGWIGDDWFHNGAFRPGGWPYVLEQEADRDGDINWPSAQYDLYQQDLDAGSAGTLGIEYGLEQTGFFTKVVNHPAYDSFWSAQATDKILAQQGTPTVPTLLVHSLWDQEDIYGDMAVWKALQPLDKDGRLFLSIGPWFHHQARLDGSSIGPIRFGADTGPWWRREVLTPFLDRALKGEGSMPLPARVTAFQTGTDRWQSLQSWPSCSPAPCQIKQTPIFLAAGRRLSFSRPTVTASADSYLSDPAKPVPFLPRPINLSSPSGYATWQNWLVSDQRDVASRPDVLSYVTDPLTSSVELAGQPVADIVEATTGTDMDVVVKLIDVYPDEYAEEPDLGGYQLMISAEILRGRYRQDPSHPQPITPGTELHYKFNMPPVNHVFLPGHRIMVQVQSSWFPLYDRNPQTFVPNIFWAKPSDYHPETVSVLHDVEAASAVILPLTLSQQSRSSILQ